VIQKCRGVFTVKNWPKLETIFVDPKNIPQRDFELIDPDYIVTSFEIKEFKYFRHMPRWDTLIAIFLGCDPGSVVVVRSQADDLVYCVLLDGIKFNRKHEGDLYHFTTLCLRDYPDLLHINYEGYKYEELHLDGVITEFSRLFTQITGVEPKDAGLVRYQPIQFGWSNVVYINLEMQELLRTQMQDFIIPTR
jgi:hypothetical protein